MLGPFGPHLGILLESVFQGRFGAISEPILGASWAHFGAPRWLQNRSKIDQKSMKNRSKIDQKSSQQPPKNGRKSGQDGSKRRLERCKSHLGLIWRPRCPWRPPGADSGLLGASWATSAPPKTKKQRPEKDFSIEKNNASSDD